MYGNEARINAIIDAAGRGDRTVVPMLRETLEQVLAHFSASREARQQAMAELAKLPASQFQAAMLDAKMPVAHFDQLLIAAMQIPDASFEGVLKALSQRFSHEGVRNALAKARAVAPATGHAPEVKDLTPPTREQMSGSTGLARMVTEDDHKGILEAVTEASIGDLLSGLAAAIRQEKGSFVGAFSKACHRYPEAEVLFIVRPWHADADPYLRQAAAMALGRWGEGKSPDPRVIDMLHRSLTDQDPTIVIAALYALAQRTDRLFTKADLDLMQSSCEMHPSDVVREAYTDVFHSPFVGHEDANGAVDAWCAMTRDAEQRIRYTACSHLSVCLAVRHPAKHVVAQISAALDAAKTDESASVRFIALEGLSRCSQDEVLQIERELTRLADQLESSDVAARTGEEDDGLDEILQIVDEPSHRYILPLRRIARRLKGVEGYWSVRSNLEHLLKSCRKAPRGNWFIRLLSG